MAMRRLRWLLPLLLAVYLLTGVAQIGPGERGVVRRFGRVVARPTPGLWIGLPWGIDTLDRVQVRAVRQLAVGYDPDEASDAPGLSSGQFLTGDQNLVNARITIEYAIDETGDHLDDELVNRSERERVLSRETEALAAEWLSARTVDAVLSGRAELAQHIGRELPPRIESHRLGIVVQRSTIDWLVAPEEVRESFEAVNKAQTQIRTRRNQAEQEAARQLSEASLFASKLKGEAAAYRIERQKQANAEATTFLAREAQYRQARAKNPDVLRTLWREEIAAVLAGVKERGRIELLDDRLGPNGLELHQFLPAKSK